MKTTKKAEGEPLQTIPFDDEDRKVLLPLIRTVSEGKAAEKVLKDYIGAIKRRSGLADREVILVKDCSRMVVSPEAKA